ncbi:MAG: DUF2240 family protein [Candidatus Heimdallarchaeota archaeon]
MSNKKSGKVEDVWGLLKDRAAYTRADFLLRIKRLAEEMKISQEAAAYIVAKEQGVDISGFLAPAKRGRILDVGQVKISKTGGVEVPYCLFTLVNNEERLLGCAFGDRAEEIKDLEDRAVEIIQYTIARSTRQKMLRATENSEIRILSDDTLPPVWELETAKKGSLEEMSKTSKTWIVEGVVVDMETTEYDSCPTCGRRVEPRDEGWFCTTHGLVDVQARMVLHLYVADSSGIYPAVYFGKPLGEELFKKKIRVKGYFRSGELQISKFYLPKI